MTTKEVKKKIGSVECEEFKNFIKLLKAKRFKGKRLYRKYINACTTPNAGLMRKEFESFYLRLEKECGGGITWKSILEHSFWFTYTKEGPSFWKEVSSLKVSLF